MSVLPSATLRRVLIADAVSCLGMGLLFLVATGWIHRTLGIPAALQYGATVILIGFAALLLVLARGRSVYPGALRLVVLGNAAWVLLSLVYLLGAPGLTVLGQGFVLVQGAAVAILAWLEHRHGASSGVLRSPSLV